METDERPEREIEIVPDAALPEEPAILPDIVRGTELPSSRSAPSAAEVEAAHQQGIAGAEKHLERERRRRERHPAPGSWRRLALDEVRYCVIDLETTGSSAAGAGEILEVGAVRVEDGELGAEFATLVRPRGPIDAGAQRVHGITTDMVAGAPAIEAVLPLLQEVVRDRVLVFHNAPFDLGFLQRAFAAAGREQLASPVLDTLVIARQLLGGACGLGALGRRLGLAAPHLHRGLADARLTAQLLLAELAWLEEAGAQTLGDVPGVGARPPRQRRPRTPRGSELWAALAHAIEAGIEVELVYRLGPGLEPQRVIVRPLAVEGGACRARLREHVLPVLLAIERIEVLRPLT